MIVSAIAAMSANRVIGKDGDLPWKIPEDMQFFRDKTKGHIMIMGRKTFESFGSRPLPGRLHVVITRDQGYSADGVEIFYDIESALAFARKKTAQWGDEVFVIGGGEIYKQMLPYTDRIYLTEIQREFEGDARFPEFNKGEFVELERRHREEPVPFDFVTYQRKAR